ncbi:MAG: DUF427 domain-containing protein [Pseudomonadota bacterium]
MASNRVFTPVPGLCVVRAGGAVIGESYNTISLKEGSLPEVLYFPREDMGMAFLEASTKRTHCPWKGDAQYYSIIAKSGAIEDAGWSYEDPLEEAAVIRGHIAFSHDRVAVERL